MLCRSTLIVGLSLLTAASLPAQTPGALAPAPPSAANQPPSLSVGQEEKEKAEDAALLKQLDEGAPAMPSVNKRRNLKPGTAAAGVGTFRGPFRGQALMARPVTPKALVVRTATPEPKAQAALEEDLAVMAHLLEKALDELPGGQPRSMNALGIEVAFPGGAGAVRSLYLDNYGALFFLHVGFPVVGPSEKQPQEKPTGDSAWEDARQELYGRRLRGAAVGEPTEEYSPEKVERLKQTLLETLKNATNIRELKPDEFVTVWVLGGVTGNPAMHIWELKNNPPGTLGGNIEFVEPQTAVSGRTVLTLRARKSEIDAYAKGSLTPEEFAKRARITTYTDEMGEGGLDVLTGGGAYTLQKK